MARSSGDVKVEVLAQMNLLQSRTLLTSALLGLAYGLFCRLIATVEKANVWFPVMSIAFIMLVPLGMGFIAAYNAERKERHGPISDSLNRHTQRGSDLILKEFR